MQRLFLVITLNAYYKYTENPFAFILFPGNGHFFIITLFVISKRGKSKEKPPNKGSTRLPKFPVVDFSSSKENATKCFPYSEVPKFR